MPNTTIEYKCDLCNYACGNKKFNYNKHLNSKRHLNKVNGDNMSDTSDTSDITEAAEYCTISSLTQSRNLKPKPTPKRLPPQPTNTNAFDFQMQFILQEITLLKSQNLIYQTEITNLKSQNLIYQNEMSNLKSQVSSLETKILILNNNEIQAMKTTQQIHSITPSYQPMYSIPPNNQQPNNITPNIQ